MVATNEWQPYDGDYEKERQDIRTKDGKEYLDCWPNAGKWFVLSLKHQPLIPNEDVTHIRLHKDNNNLR